MRTHSALSSPKSQKKFEVNKSMQQKFRAWRRCLSVLAMALLLLPACRLESSTPEDVKEPKALDPNEPPPQVEAQKVLSIGDVEAIVGLTGTIAKESEGPQIDVFELKKPSSEISMATLTVYPPYPEQLWVEFILGDTRDYRERPIAIRGAITRQIDGGEVVPIDTIASIVGLKEQLAKIDIAKQSPRVFRIDLLADLQEMPKTMLVIAKAEALLMPVDTDVTTLDPVTAETDESNIATLFSNPIRVNFETEAPAL